MGKEKISDFSQEEPGKPKETKESRWDFMLEKDEKGGEENRGGSDQRMDQQ